MVRGAWALVAVSLLVACDDEPFARVRDVPGAPFVVEWAGAFEHHGAEVAFPVHRLLRGIAGERSGPAHAS